MQVQTMQGYFDNGVFYQQGRRMSLPERQLVIVNVLDVPVDVDEEKKINTEFWAKFDDMAEEVKAEEMQARIAWLSRLESAIKESMDEEMPEFPPQGLMKEPHGLKD